VGAVPIDVNNDGYTSQFGGYKFKVSRFIYADEYSISGVFLDVQKPDGTITSAKMGYDECHKTYYDAQIGDVVLRLISAHVDAQYTPVRIYAWDYRSIPVMKKRQSPEKPDPSAELLDVSSEGFTAKYGNYKFKISDLQYKDDYHPNIVSLDVQKPDGVIYRVGVREGMTSHLDELNFASPFCGYTEEYMLPDEQGLNAAIWVWKGGSGPDTPPEEMYPLTYTPAKPPVGAVPLDLNSEGFVGGFGSYKFKVDHLVYLRAYGVGGIYLDVQKPDGTIVRSRFGYDKCHNTYYDGQVDDVVLRLVSAYQYAALQEARVYAWSYKATPIIKKKADYVKPDPGAVLLEDVNNDGFDKEYRGYKFKVDSFVYPDGGYHVSGILLDVMLPDGTVKQVTLNEGSQVKVEGINIASPFCESIEEVYSIQRVALWVW